MKGMSLRLIRKSWILMLLYLILIQLKPTEVDQRKEVLKGPELERWYFSDWHYPYSNVLPSEVLNKIWSDISMLADESEFDHPPSQWVCIGPNGMGVSNPNIKWSGRILNRVGNIVDPIGNYGTASGGLWFYDGSNWTPKSDSITSLSIGAFTWVSGPQGISLVGTGEPILRRGTGLWRSTDYGVSWTNIPMNPGSNPHPKWFYRILDWGSGLVFAATDTALYKSNDYGVSWSIVLSGEATDIEKSAWSYNPFFYNYIYTCIKGGSNQGIWSSTDLGNSWARLGGGLPTTNIGRTSLSCPSTRNEYNPPYTGIDVELYASIARLDNDNFLGVYKSYDGGYNWYNVTSNLPADLFGNQGWYDNIIELSDHYMYGNSYARYDTVIAGGVKLYRTFDGGVSWTQVIDTNVHADHHRASFFYSYIFDCNDGGISYSSDFGLTWTTSFNSIPITQYYGFDAGISNPNVIFGGSQDNGISGTLDGGATWGMVHYPGVGGDGGGTTVDPSNPLNIFGILGVYPAPISFLRFRSTNAGLSWTAVNGGIAADANWAPKIRSDKHSPQKLYTNANNFVYISTDDGSSWTTLNAAGFISNVANVTVSRNTGSGSVVYACLNSTDPSNKLKVYDGGTWYERSTGFPAGLRVRTVATHPNNINRAYALMNGLGTPPVSTPKIFKTSNRGITWIDITGNLPDLPLGDLIPHPADTNILYLGTEMGCYKTTNEGSTWFTWNTGMPKANIITEMTYIDSAAQNGRFYILAASYGRSIWKRQIDEMITVVESNSNEIPYQFALLQNYPNPFNPITQIKYAVPKTSFVRLTVCNVLGQEVATLVNAEQEAGHMIALWDGRNSEGQAVGSGLFFYRLEARPTDGGRAFVQVKKMLLLK
jgi:hypothetical protein